MQAQFVKQFSVPESTLDIGCRYRWKWDWLDTLDDQGGVKFSQFYQKLKRNGLWWCEICKKTLDYSKSGSKALTIHASGQKHKTKCSEWRYKKAKRLLKVDTESQQSGSDKEYSDHEKRGK